MKYLFSNSSVYIFKITALEFLFFFFYISDLLFISQRIYIISFFFFVQLQLVNYVKKKKGKGKSQIGYMLTDGEYSGLLQLVLKRNGPEVPLGSHGPCSFKTVLPSSINSLQILKQLQNEEPSMLKSQVRHDKCDTGEEASDTQFIFLAPCCCFFFPPSCILQMSRVGICL